MGARNPPFRPQTSLPADYEYIDRFIRIRRDLQKVAPADSRHATIILIVVQAGLWPREPAGSLRRP